MRQGHRLFTTISLSIISLIGAGPAVFADGSRSPIALKYEKLGQEQSRLFESDKAIALFTKGIALCPTDADLYSNRRHEYERLYLYDKALADCEKCIKLQPERATFWRDKGYLLDRLKKPHEAIAAYTRAVQLQPSDSGGYTHRGDIYRHLGEYKKAIQDYEESLKHCEQKGIQDELNVLGNLYLKIGDNQKAIKTFARAIKLVPDLPQNYYGRAQAYENIGNHPGAYDDRQTAKKLEKEY